jgi:nitrite reductase/ring-hydroxylating ferredoxin subunit
MPFVTIFKTTDLPAGAACQVEINGKQIGVWNVGGTFCALEDVCPHRGASLSEGRVTGEEVECPWHRARFNLKTGAHQCAPAPRGVAPYKVQVIGDEVQLEV